MEKDDDLGQCGVKANVVKVNSKLKGVMEWKGCITTTEWTCSDVPENRHFLRKKEECWYREGG
eukprot:1624196-Prorocentrum_lima.AAC.1